MQSKSAKGDSDTVMLILYKEGQEGHGRPSDIMLRRVVSTTSGNPYKPSNVICEREVIADNGQTVCVDGTQNMSTVFPTEYGGVSFGSHTENMNWARFLLPGPRAQGLGLRGPRTDPGARAPALGPRLMRL